MGERAKCGN